MAFDAEEEAAVISTASLTTIRQRVCLLSGLWFTSNPTNNCRSGVCTKTEAAVGHSDKICGQAYNGNSHNHNGNNHEYNISFSELLGRNSPESQI